MATTPATTFPSVEQPRSGEHLRGEAGVKTPHQMSSRALDRLAVGVRGTVRAVLGPSHSPHWAMQLEEIGFIPGEQVMVMARAPFGGDPMVVRVGESTFALRRAEASCVLLAAWV